MARHSQGKHTSREEHALRVDGQGVYDGIVPAEVEDKGALGTLPLLDVVATGGG